MNSVIVPVGVIRPIAPRDDSVNQRFPSGPATIVYGRLFACGSGNSVTVAGDSGVWPSALGRPTSCRGKANETSVDAIHGLNTRLPLGQTPSEI